MKKLAAILFLLAIVSAGKSYGDEYPLLPWNYSLDVATGARAVAMGSAVSANPDLITSFRFNPGVLAEEEGLRTYYSLRPSNVGGYESDFYSLGLVLETSLAGFALDYTRNASEERGVLVQPDFYYTQAECYDYTITASAARQLYRSLSAGISLKYFKRGVDYKNFSVPDSESGGAVAGDIGLYYRLEGLTRSGSAEDHFRFGVSIRNMATNSDYAGREWKLPTILRTGFSYQIARDRKEEAELIRIVLSVEYRRWLNRDEMYEDQTDYFSYGIESRLLETFSLRLGGLVPPEYGIYGIKEDMVFVYGAGLEFSIRRFSSAGVPLSVSLDYAYVPTVDSHYYFDDDNSANVFTVSIRYNNQIF